MATMGTGLDAWSEADRQRSGFDADGKATPAARAQAGKPQLLPSPGLAAWLAGSGGSLALSTYQTGRLFFLGTQVDGSLAAQERQVGPAMGLAVDGATLWVGGRDRIWRYANTGPGQLGGQQHDAVFMPRSCHLVGVSHTHDVIANVRFQGRHHDVLFANTQYSCVAAPDPHYSFLPVWRPGFISALAAQDRCHLNGICARDGELAYATVCGAGDTPHAWKDSKTGGGLVIDIASGETVCEGLSMPHSPRWHEGRLWLINAGEAQLGYVDFASRRLVPVATCQGFARGIAFVGGHAVIGLSRLRPQANGLVGNINLIERLEQQGFFQRCGLLVIDLATGKLAHWLTIEGPVTELYDVAFLPGLRQPGTPGFRDPDALHSKVFLPST